MNNPTADFEEWLDSIGFNTSSPETHTQAEQAAVDNSDLPPEPQTIEEEPAIEAQPVSFSEEDMDSILAENGYVEHNEQERPIDAINTACSSLPTENTIINDMVMITDTGEITVSTSSGEQVIIGNAYQNNVYQDRDLEAEEDADWQQAIESGNIVHVEQTASVSSEATEAPIIPPNSPTLTVDDSTSRFSGTEWFDEIGTKTITIAGCGGIGSNAAYQIARLKPYSIVLYDDDTVETANLSGQLFSRKDIGKKKVSAVHDMLYNYTNMYNIRALSHRFTSETLPTDIMLCGFDSMEARKTYYNAWKNHLAHISEDRWKDCFFMDGRLTIDTLQVFCLTGEDSYNMERYEREFLFDDSQAESEVCSMKQTTYLACMIGSIMTNLFINWVASSLDPIIPYKLPFFTQYEAQHMIFKTEE